MGIRDFLKERFGLGQKEQYSAVLDEAPRAVNWTSNNNTIPGAIEDAVRHAREIGKPVRSELNGVDVFVDGQSDPQQAYSQYGEAQRMGQKSTMTADNPAYQRHRYAQRAFSVRADVLATPEATRDHTNPFAYEITPQNFDFSPENSTAVISNAQKFILPVPAFADGGEPLVHPRGDKQGQPITDWEGKPIGERGVVFSNPKDMSTQGVQGDGSGVIIMNEVTAAQAEKLKGKVNQMGGDPNAFSVDQVKDLLSYAKNDLGIKDMYNSDKGFVGSKMNQIESHSSGIEAYGLHRRDDRDVCQAVFVSEVGRFTGNETTHSYSNGAVILKQGDDHRLIQPAEFERTYTHANGNRISRDDLAVQGNPRSAETGLTAADQAMRDSAETNKAAAVDRFKAATEQVNGQSIAEAIKAGVSAPPQERSAPAQQPNRNHGIA
jgi:hypothetical protein